MVEKYNHNSDYIKHFNKEIIVYVLIINTNVNPSQSITQLQP